MFNSSLRVEIKNALKPRTRGNRPQRLALVGIGNELNGDDGAGPAVIRGLRSILKVETILLVDAGPAPENITGRLRRFEPDWVVLVDAAEMGAAPGTVRWLDPHDTTGFSAATHGLPLGVLAGYLETELGCKVGLVGIQPEGMEMGSGLSQAVQSAVETLKAGMRELVRE